MLSGLRGMTLLELLCVIVILGVLGGMSAWLHRATTLRAERSAVASLLQQNATALERFYSEHGSYKQTPTQWPTLPHVAYPAGHDPRYILAFASLPRNTDADYYVLRATAQDHEEGYIELLSTGMMRRCVPDGRLWRCSSLP